jgi:FHA domain
MKYVHLKCLQEWLNSRKVTKETPVTKTFYWKSLECELCKATYPNNVRMLDNKNIFLRVIQYETPNYDINEAPHYVVLESVSNNTNKVIHVINMLHINEIKLGRGHDADVRVTDISVSRFHASLRKSPKGYFIIEDNHSKFGTLALIKSPLPLSVVDTNYIQAGRTLVEISIRRPIKLLDSCCCT